MAQSEARGKQSAGGFAGAQEQTGYSRWTGRACVISICPGSTLQP